MAEEKLITVISFSEHMRRLQAALEVLQKATGDSHLSIIYNGNIEVFQIFVGNEHDDITHEVVNEDMEQAATSLLHAIAGTNHLTP